MKEIGFLLYPISFERTGWNLKKVLFTV